MNKSFELKHPIVIQLEVTEDCNHSCFYCYNSWKTDNLSKNKMSLEDSKKIGEKIINEVKPFHVVLTGGEPMLNISVITSLMKQFKNAKIGYNINSNIILMNEKHINELLEVDSNLGILTSLPHFKRRKFQKITGRNNLNLFYKNLEIIISKGVKVHPNMVIHKMNHKDVYNEGKFLYENFGLTHFSATPMLKPAGRNSLNYLSREEMIDSLENLLKLNDDFNLHISVLEAFPKCFLPEKLRYNPIFDRSCSGGRSSMAFAYNGDAKMCTHSPIIEGNILKQHFSEIWENFSQYRQNKYLPEECEPCVEVSRCHGGCRFEGYMGGRINKKDSRMIEPLTKYQKMELPTILSDKIYKVSNFKVREEKEDMYTIYNGKAIFANQGLKDFLELSKRKGYFRLDDFSFDSKIKDKAESFAKILVQKNFFR